jgi:hypothetical protein
MSYYSAMTKYPKFQALPIAFKVFKSMTPKLKQWFESEKCQSLDHSDFQSEQFWKDVDDDEEMEFSPQRKTKDALFHPGGQSSK